jgi:RimJ/RimL family protein N-acetyltransferase
MFNSLNLTDGVISLRAFQQDDAAPLYRAALESLTDLIPWMSWAHPDYRESEMDEYVRIVRRNWEMCTQYAFAIADLHDGSMLGAASLSHIHPVYNFCNLGYWIRSSRRGNGLAGRAARLAAKFAFEQVGLIRVEVVVAVKNGASLKVAEKIGAHREGILRNRIIVREAVHDAVMFSFVPIDFGLAAS